MSLHSFLRSGAAPAPPTRITIRRRLLGRSRRLPAVGLAVGLLSLGLASVQTTHAATKTWDGSIADWYSDPTHWSPSGFPAAGDDARNLFTNAAMTLGNDATVNSFFSNSAFTLNGGTFSGSQANAASLLTVNNVFTMNGGTINNFTVNAGTQQAGQPAPTVIFTTNGNNVLSNTTVNGGLDFATRGDAFTHLYGVDTFNGNTVLGTTTGGGQGLHLQGQVNSSTAGNTLVNNGTLSGFGFVVQDHSGATVTNNGIFNANTASQTLVTGVDTFNNNAGATLEATNSGTLNLSNTLTTNNGALAATGGGVINLTGGTTLQSNADGSINTVGGMGTTGGTFNVQGAALLGTLNGVGASSLVFNTDGRNTLGSVGGTATANITLDLATRGDAFLQLLGVDTLNGSTLLGTTTGGGQGLHLLGQVNAATAGNTLVNNGTLSGFGFVVQDNGGATVTNNGTINANTPGQTLTVSVDNFKNTGTANVTNGAALTVNSGNATNSGAISAIQGGTASFSSGLTQTAGSTNVFGTVNASEALKGGVLEGFGKVVGNVTNTGGIVQSTTPTGLTIQGNFTQASGGELDAFFGNNFHDLLTVTGQTTLAGTLGVFDLDQAQPAGMAAAGSQFSFLNYSSGTLVASGTLGGFTQYFSNEIPLDNNTGTILGQNGFTYQLINNTANKSLDLKVVTAGSPVPEASTTVSLGLLLALGLGGMVIAAKRKKSA